MRLWLLFAFVVFSLGERKPFETLISLDCSGTFRALPDSLFSFGTKLNVLDHYNVIMGQLYNRIKIRCPSVSDAEFRARFNPTDVLLNNIDPNQTPKWDIDACLDDVSKSFTRDLHKGLKVMASALKVQLPVSCTYDNYLTTGCLAQIKLPRVNSFLQFAWKSCPSSYLPHFSVHCAGDACNMLKPCNDDADCPASQTCQTLLDSSVISEEDAFNFMKELNFYAGSDEFTNTTCTKPRQLLTNIVAKVKSFWPNAASGNSLRVCTLRNGDDVQTDLDDFGAKWTGSSTETPVVCGDPCNPARINCQNGGQCVASFGQAQCQCTDQFFGYDCSIPISLSPQYGMVSSGSLNYYGNYSALWKDPADPPLLVWDGKLESGEAALSSARLSGATYSPIRPPPVPTGESHLFGVSCGGDVSMFASEAYGLTLQIVNIHELGQYIMNQLKALYDCRGISADDFILNQVLWLPDVWLAKLFTLADGSIPNVSLISGSLASRLFENGMSPLRKAATYVQWRVGRALGRKASIQEVATEAHNRFVEVVKRPLLAVVQRTAPLLTKLGQISPVAQVANSMHFAARRFQTMAKVSAQQSTQTRITGLSTFDYNVWRAKHQMALRFTAFPNILGEDFDLRLRVEQCPAVAFMTPNAHVTCKGATCDAFHLKLDCVDQACAAGQKCVAARSWGIYDYDYFAIMLWGGFSSQMPSFQQNSQLCTLTQVGPSATALAYAGDATSPSLWATDVAAIYKSVTGNGSPLAKKAELQLCVPDMDALSSAATNRTDYIVSKSTSWGTQVTVTDLQALPNAFPEPAVVSFVLAGSIQDWTEEKQDRFKADVADLVHVHKNFLTCKIHAGSVNADVTIQALPNPTAVAENIQTEATNNEQFKQASNVQSVTVQGAAPAPAGFPVVAVVVIVAVVAVIGVGAAIAVVVLKRKRAPPANVQLAEELMEK